MLDGSSDALFIRDDTTEAQHTQIKRINKGADYAHGVVLTDVVVNRLRQKRRFRDLT